MFVYNTYGQIGRWPDDFLEPYMYTFAKYMLRQ